MADAVQPSAKFAARGSVRNLVNVQPATPAHSSASGNPYSIGMATTRAHSGTRPATA